MTNEKNIIIAAKFKSVDITHETFDNERSSTNRDDVLTCSNVTACD